MPEKPVKRRLKLILVFRAVPNDDIELRELLERFGLIERFTPYVSGGRGAVRGDEAREWLGSRPGQRASGVGRYAPGERRTQPFRELRRCRS